MISKRHLQDGAPRKYDSWSNRFLTLAVAGILFLTMYPFQVSHAKPHGHTPVFLLGHGGKMGGAMDVFLNILLFVPFGFGLGSKFIRRGKSRKLALIAAIAAGALFSYGIELAQLYIPARDSGWGDVFTNTTGSAIGCIAALLLGAWLFKMLSAAQDGLSAWLTPRRLACVLLIYFAVWCAASVLLGREASLADWRTGGSLIFANDATGRHPWNGRLLQVQIWNRALSGDIAEKLTQTSGAIQLDDPLVNRIFSPDASTQDQNEASAALKGSSADRYAPKNQGEPAGAWAMPAASVVQSLKQENRFSIRAVFVPAEGPRPNGRILSLSQRSGASDFYLAQENGILNFWFRTGVSGRPGFLAWKIPDALQGDAARTVLLSYDGSTIMCYIDGTRIQSHAMGPGVALASRFRHIKAAELNGYRDIYFAVVFFPAGVLAGLALSLGFWRRAQLTGILIFAVVLAPLLLEWIVALGSRGAFSGGNVVRSAVLVVLGFLWIKADGPVAGVREASRPASAEAPF